MKISPLPVSAGAAQDASDPQDIPLDLNSYLIRKPDSTYGLRVEGDSMQDAHISPGDLLIVDRDADYTENSIIIVEVDGQFTVKRVQQRGGRLWLVPSNRRMSPIEVRPDQQCSTWGVVQFIIKKCPPG